MTASRHQAATAALLAVAGSLLLAVAAAAAAVGAHPAGGAVGGARFPLLPDRLGVSTRFTHHKVDTCSGVVRRGPVQCPCDLSLRVYTKGLTKNLSWALDATVERDGRDVEILRTLPVVATRVVPQSQGEFYTSGDVYRSIEVAGPVSLRLSLIAGSSVAECRDARVEVGMEPKPVACPVRNVSPGGKGRTVRSAPSTAPSARLLARSVKDVDDATPAPHASAAAAPVARIVGGRPMQTAAEQALLARLFDLTGSPMCTGSFFAPHHVVTAAHCSISVGAIVQVFPPRGDSDAPAVINMTVITAANHPLYDSTPAALYDVAVLTLRPPEGTSPAEVAAAPWPRLVLNGDAAMPADGDAVRAAGFGLVVDGGFASDKALFVDTLALTPDQAAAYQRDVEQPRRYPEGRDGPVPPEEALDHPARLCTAIWEGDCSTCQGDSGGPIYHVLPPTAAAAPRGAPTYVQVGITSYGEGCGRPDTVDVTARVSTVKKWVDWQMRAAPGGAAGAAPATHPPGRSMSA